MELAELRELLIQRGIPAFRAVQAWHGLYRQFVSESGQIKGLPADVKKCLEDNLILASAVQVKLDGEPAGTRKLLVGLHDGERVEEVLIPGDGRYTVCVSSQVGCKFKCAFCASGQAGFRRSLDAGEMVGQVVLAARDCRAGASLTNVVFMGIGEPFDNYDAVLKAVRIINDHEGLSIGARRITISTSGIVPGIERLAGEGLQVELSVSLHAADNKLRTELMPVNRKYPLPDLIAACKAYTAKTKRIITFEYTLMKDLNDRQDHAGKLAELLRSFPCRVNLIPLSPVKEFSGVPSTPEAAKMFIKVLRKARINATLRASRGAVVNAACGQLRSSHDV